MRSLYWHNTLSCTGPHPTPIHSIPRLATLPGFMVGWKCHSSLSVTQERWDTLNLYSLIAPDCSLPSFSLPESSRAWAVWGQRSLPFASLPFPRWKLSEFPGQSIVGMIPQDFLKLFLEAVPASFRPARFPWAGTSSKTLLKALRNGMIFYHPSTCTFCSHLPFFDIDYTFITLLWSSRTS